MRHAAVLTIVATTIVMTLAPVPVQGAWTPPPCTGVFSDVPCASQFAAWIEQLAADGISSGCAAGLYCPDSPVTRRQMAVFLERAMRGTATWPPRLVRVSAVRISDGTVDPEASGQALRDAVDAIPTSGSEAPADGNPWLVVVGPGVFDLATSFLSLPPFVHLTGSGREVTMVRSSSGNGVVRLASSTSLRDVTVKCAGSGGQAIAINLDAAVSVVIRDVALSAAGGGNTWAIYCEDSDVLVDHVEISAAGSFQNTGIHSANTSLTVRDSKVYLAGGTATKVGIFQGVGSLTLERSSVTVDGSATTSVGVRVYGIELGAASNVLLTELTANVFGAPTQQDVGIAADASTEPRTFEIHRSSINGADVSVKSASNVTIRVAESQLKGGPVLNGSGSVTCFAVYDETFSSPGLTTCP